MKHAGPQTLAALAPLLAQLRAALPAAVERKAGTFYRKGQAFLHFHEDPAGLFADLKVAGQWQRSAVNTAAERAALVRAAKSVAEPRLP